MKIKFNKQFDGQFATITLLPTIFLDLSRNYKGITISWILWSLIIYSTKGGQP